MLFSESYLFVLILSSSLSIPISLAVRTLLAMKTHLVFPILRLRLMNDLTETRITEAAATSTVSQGNASPSIHAGRQSW